MPLLRAEITRLQGELRTAQARLATGDSAASIVKLSKNAIWNRLYR